MVKDHWNRIKHQRDRNQQYAALYLGAQLEQDRDKFFLGSAKVSVDALTFDPSAPRDVHEHNIKRLLSSFKLSGPSQLEPSHHVPAIITRVEFAEAISKAGSTQQVTRERDSSKWPLLIFTSNFQLQCLRGKHRIEVAKQYLLGRNRWWIVDFYAEDLSTGLRNYLTYQTSNEQPPSAGEIYFRILQSDHAVGEDVDLWWAQIQSVNERTELQRLFARRTLNAPFRALAQIPACGRGMLAGYVGSLLRLKCDEEIIHYLNHIYRAWSFMLDGNREWMSKIDVRTIECLASHSPARSRSDKAYLEPLMTQGSIFQSFTRSERDHIWSKLCRYPYRIPSLRTFFKDMLYLEMLAECVKRLIKPLRRQSLFKALRQAHVDVHEPHVGGNNNSTFRKSYRSLYLSAMRHLEALRPGSVLLEADDKRIPVGESRQAWSAFAEEAYRLGFRSEAIDVSRALHPDRQAAAAFLVQVRDPVEFTYEESERENLINEMVAIFDRAKKIHVVEDRPLLVCEGKGEVVQRRSGRPFRTAYETSARHLLLDNMSLPNNDAGGGITAFFIRRDVYLSFFGPCDVIDEASEDNTSLCDSARSSPSDDRTGLFLPESASDIFSDQGSNAIDAPSGDDYDIDSPDSRSQYSQPSLGSRQTEPPLVDHPVDHFGREMSVDPDTEAEPSHGVRLVLTSLAGSQPEVVEDRHIVDLAAVEPIVGQYVSRGLFLFDSNLRSLAATQCLDVALEGGSIYLIPEARSTSEAATILDPSSLKRPAPTELISPRPRKFYVADR